MVPTNRGNEDEHVAVLAHGLLNPMAVIVGSIDVALGEGALEGHAREALEAGRRQAVAVTESLRQLAQGLPPEVVSGAAEVSHEEP